MIYFALIIPVLVAVLYKIAFRRKVTYGEFALTLVIALVATLITAVTYTTIGATDRMIESGYVVGKKHIPGHFETRVHTVCTGSGKSNSCHTETYTVWVGPTWTIYTDKIKETDLDVKPASYGGQQIGNLWGSAYSCSKDRYSVAQIGDIAAWKRFFLNPLKLTRSHLYKKVDDKKYPKPNHPEIYDLYKINRISFVGNVSLSSSNNYSLINEHLNAINSYLNSTNINVGIVITTLPYEYGEYLENLWKGGKPNDFILVLNVDTLGEITNTHIICWDNEYLRVTLEDIVRSGNYNINDLDSIIDIVYTVVKKHRFTIADFKKFNYIQVELPFKFLLFLYIFIALVSVGVSECFRQNDWNSTCE